jgi:hypothetical protein
MRKRLLTSLICTVSTAAMSSLTSIAAAAEPAAAQTDPTIDQDGQKICGYDLMNDSEKAGYRNIMHKTKVRADRDEIRMYHCQNMQKRAAEAAAKSGK